MLNISTLKRQKDLGGCEGSPGAAPSNYNTVGRLRRTQPAVGK